MANGPEQQNPPEIGDVKIQDGMELTWIRLEDGTEEWKPTILVERDGDLSPSEVEEEVEETHPVTALYRDIIPGAAKDYGLPFARSAAQGVFGLSDELRGAGKALVTAMPFGRPIGEAGEAYREGKQAELQALEDVPLPLRVGGELTGAVLSGSAALKAISSIPRAGRAIQAAMQGRGKLLGSEKLARGTATGAAGGAEGLLYGAGTAEGTEDLPFSEAMKKRMEVAEGMGLWGAGAGAALPFIPVLGRITKPLTGDAPPHGRMGEVLQEGVEKSMGVRASPLRPTVAADVTAVTKHGAKNPLSASILGIEGSGQVGGLLTNLQNRGKQNARKLEQGLEEVREKFFKPLENTFVNDWNPAIRTKGVTGTAAKAKIVTDLRKTNDDAITFLIDEIQNNKDLVSALRGRSLSGTENVDPDIIQNLGEYIRGRSKLIKRAAQNREVLASRHHSTAEKDVATKALKNIEKALKTSRMLGYEELSMLRRNLKPLRKDVPGAENAVNQLDRFMIDLFGDEVETATALWARRSQVDDIFNVSRGTRNISTLTDNKKIQQLFKPEKLESPGGLREAVEKIPDIVRGQKSAEHIIAMERELKLGILANKMANLKNFEEFLIKDMKDGGFWVKELFKTGGNLGDDAGRAFLQTRDAIRRNLPNFVDTMAQFLYRHAGWMTAAAVVGGLSGGLIGGGGRDN
jgi:hypothetical protein